MDTRTMLHPGRLALLALAVAATAAPIAAQSISLKTVPIATGEQYLIFPSRGMGMGGLSIASRPPNFLVIGFQGRRQIGVNHKAHVWFVDAHAKCNGGNNDDTVLTLEPRLMVGARQCVHAGMVGQGLDALRLQPRGGLFDFAPRQAVDDAGIAGMFVSQEMQ